MIRTSTYDDAKWKLVPVVATDEMVDAAANAPDDDCWNGAWLKSYAAALSAAPEHEDEGGSSDDPREFGCGIETTAKERYWQRRAAFWREHAVRLGYVPEDSRPLPPAPKGVG